MNKIFDWKFKNLSAQLFPTPMEEPKKVIKALYLGSVQVNRASGMDVLNDAIDRLAGEKPQNEWEPVNVAVAPSTITISDLEVNEDNLGEGFNGALNY